MSYYAGDYYAGGYYAGGVFGSLWTGIKRTVGGAVGGLIKGGPVGAILGAAGGAVRATKENIARETVGAGGSGSALTPAMIAKHKAAVARGGAGGGAPKPSTAMVPTGGGMMMVGGGYGRSRRMNWANHRALARAERRIHSAVKHMSKYIRWVHPKKEGHAAPVFKTRKKR